MKTLRFVACQDRFLLSALLVFCLFSGFASAGASDQEVKKVLRKVDKGGPSITIWEYIDIPEATEPCTPEESDWWKRIRTAGNDLQKKNDEKLKTRFYLLLYEGQQKGYRIPLKDRSYQVLIVQPATYNVGRKHLVTGSVELSVEFRADAAVGDVQMVKGLGSEIDENVIQAWRRCVFLPAIKDRAFVTRQGEVKTKFSDKWSK